MAKKATSGNNAQFTYDFGIAIAQSTVNKVTRLTGASLTLASAFYALKTTATEYVGTLRENTLRFGGVLSTMKAIEQAQNRLIKGQSYFNVDDQLRGMNDLMAVGIDARENLEWINKAAHATGKNFAEFSGMIASAIQGNTSALVDAGLMTQRATRMFDKYEANTIMRQQAILDFVKNHKGLMNAIKNDFETIQDQSRRIKATWQSFLKSIMGSPKDPNSFYGQIVSSMRMVAEALSRNSEQIQRYGFVIGQTLGWVIKQIGHFVVWIGRQVNKVLTSVWKVTDDFQNQTRSMLVWLEFWKLRVLDFFKKYSSEIKTILKLLVAYKALKAVFVVGKSAVASVIALKNAWRGAVLLQGRYLRMMGPIGTRFSRWLMSLAAFMPKSFRRIWVSMGKTIMLLPVYFKTALKGIPKMFTSLFGFIGRGIRTVFSLVLNLPKLIGVALKGVRTLYMALLGSNPVGWVILAITLLTTLYKKSERFRVFVNTLFKLMFESIKLVWNSASYVITWVMVGFKKVWEAFKNHVWTPISNFFSWAWDSVKTLWSSFKDTSVGQWIDKWIVTPLKSAFEWILNAWNTIVSGLGKALEWLGIANTKVSTATQDLAKQQGVPTLPTFSGGTYDLNDSTDYLQNPFKKNVNEIPGANPISDQTPTELPSVNPLLVETPAPQTPPAPTSSTSMTFNNGAIQIIVDKGENIDESKLARKVREVISDLNRETNLRGGIA